MKGTNAENLNELRYVLVVMSSFFVVMWIMVAMYGGFGCFKYPYMDTTAKETMICGVFFDFMVVGLFCLTTLLLLAFQKLIKFERGVGL